jgi:uncharacterized protein YkwD
MRPATLAAADRPSVHCAATGAVGRGWTVDHKGMGPIAKLVAPAVLAAIALVLPAAASAAAPCADGGVVPTAANLSTAKQATLCLLNAERTARGMPRLTSNAQLGKAAQGYSANMVRQQFFDHTSPAGVSLHTRVRRGTTYLRGNLRSWSLGENIGWGSGELATPTQIVRSWMNSSGHRRNILDRRFRHIGIGVASGAPDDVVDPSAATYTTDFGSRVLS